MGSRYRQLSVEERRRIERWRAARVSPNEMARVLGRHRSTIFRELQRNHFVDRPMPKVVGCFARAARLQTADRRARHRKLVRHNGLRETVEERLRSGWTPEQIAGRMRLEDVRPRVCQETIYRHVYSRDGMRSELWWHLPNHRMSRRPRRARKRRAPRFGRGASILFRPEAVAHRTEFGHWEGDLVLFQQRFGQANVTSLMERVSRFTVLLRNTTKRSKPVIGKIAQAIGALPLPARRSITFGRGSEFVTWPHLQAETGTRSWLGRRPVPAPEGRGGEHQPPPPPLPASRDRHAEARRRGHPSDHRPDERDPAQMPRMENPRRSLRQEHGGDRRPTALPSTSRTVALHVARTQHGSRRASPGACVRPSPHYAMRGSRWRGTGFSPSHLRRYRRSAGRAASSTRCAIPARASPWGSTPGLTHERLSVGPTA